MPALGYQSFAYACYDGWMHRPISQIDAMSDTLAALQDEENQ